MDEIDKIRAAAANGLTKQETAALIGHTLSKEELTEFDRTKAFIKLKSRKEQEREQEQELEQLSAQVSRGIKQNMTAHSVPPIEQRYTKDQVRDCIHDHFGIMTAICNELDCSFYALTKYVRKNGLEGDVSEARRSITEIAQNTIVDCLNSNDERIRLDAAKFTLKTLGKEKGWSENPALAVAISIDDSEKEKKINAIFGITQKPEVEVIDEPDVDSTALPEEIHT